MQNFRWEKSHFRFGVDVYQKNVLEIGCGHGEICVFSSLVGAKEVVRIDLSDPALETTNILKVNIRICRK